MNHYSAPLLILVVVWLTGCTNPTVTPTWSVTPALTTQAHVEFRDLVSNPQRYDGKSLCTNGVYVSGFEASALGASTYQRGSAVYLTEPAIWVENPDIRSRTDCFKTDTTPPAEFCRAIVCGLFEAGGSYGHLGGYSFQMRGK